MVEQSEDVSSVAPGVGAAVAVVAALVSVPAAAALPALVLAVWCLGYLIKWFGGTMKDLFHS